MIRLTDVLDRTGHFISGTGCAWKKGYGSWCETVEPPVRFLCQNFIMWKENLYQPFEILVTERTVFLSGVHQHSFFELGYVLSGTG